MKKRLPPYGQRLLNLRRASDSIADVTVFFGDLALHARSLRKWRGPMIAVDAGEYKPGLFDFYPLQGLRATIVDLDDAGFEHNVYVMPPTYGKFYSFVREVCEAKAFVLLNWGAGLVETAVEVADRSRWGRAGEVKRWPSWWSDETELCQREAGAIALANIEYWEKRERASA